MNYTEKYHLPQWDESDRIMRTDFNAAMADIETGLGKTAADAAAATAKAAADAAAATAQVAADTAQAAASAANAQATANTAVANAAAAQATANAAYCPTKLPYAVGAYTGTNEDMSINLGFRPRCVIISRADGTYAYENTLVAGNNINSVRLEFTSTGFTVKKNYFDPVGSGQQPSCINTNKVQYVYIAFR